MIWPPNHLAPQSGNKTHRTDRTRTHTRCTNTLSRYQRGLANSSPLFSSSSSPLLPLSCTSIPLFNIPMEGRPYCDGRTRKRRFFSALPYHSSLVLIFLAIGFDYRRLLIIYCLFFFFWSMYNSVFPLYDWKGKLLLAFLLLWGQLLKAGGKKLWKLRKWTLMSCLRLHYGMSWTWKQANSSVVKKKNSRRRV